MAGFNFEEVIICEITNKDKRYILKDLTEYKNVLKQFEFPCELVGGAGQQVKPYFDEDMDLNEEENDEYDEEASNLEKKIIIQNLFNLNNTDDIHVIQRPPRFKNGKVKYSYHYTVDNIRISNFNIKKMLDENNIKVFDTKVYDKNRGIYSIYSTKKFNCTEKISPFEPVGNAHISKYLISYIQEDFIDYDVNFPKIEAEKKTKKAKAKDILKDILNNSKCEDLELIKGLVNCLSVERADDYKTWLDVGFCLFNIDDCLLELWDEWSQKSDSYKSGECEKLWYKMTKKGYTIGSLKYWAKNDNLAQYDKIISSSLNKYVDYALGSDGAHYDIAVLTGRLMKNKIYYDSKVKTWYIINENTNIWEQDKEGNSLYTILACDVCKLFMTRANDFSMRCEDPIKSLNDNEKAAKCLKIAKQLKNTTFMKSVRDLIKAVCSRDDFYEKYLNKNIHLFAFDNCLFDCNINEFRDIKPDDYISITAGYDYNHDTVSNEYVDKVKGIFKQIQPDKAKYQYLMDVSSMRMYGSNIFQQFYIFTGVGANGKSVWYNFMRHAFGSYIDKVNADTFTKENRGANQTSEISGVANCRGLIIEEPTETDKLIVSRLKEYSGDAPIKTRGLYQEAYSIVPQFALIFCCNDIPTLSKVEYAIARRLRVLSFDTKFCENPVLSHEIEKDDSINGKVRDDIEYRKAFMWIMIENWKQRKLLEKLDTPADVLNKSKEYMEESNEVKQFLNQYYEKVDDDKAKVGSEILFTHFKNVYRETKMRKDAFKNLVIDAGFRWDKTKKGNVFLNIKKRELNDSEDSDDE